MIQTLTHNSPLSGLAAIIMAAGQGKRMKSKLAKVLHPVAGKPMVLYVTDVACRVAQAGVGVIIGHQADHVRKVIEAAGRAVSIAEQREQLGTGHAVRQARMLFADDRQRPTRYLILNGDTPLLTESTVRKLVAVHDEQKAAVTVLTAVLQDATGYGRVIRRRWMEWEQGASDNAVEKIVEDKDASPEERSVREINVGTYVVDGDFLFPALDRLDPRNAQGEYYLTDIVQMAVAESRHVAAVRLRAVDEGLGINSRAQLAQAERVIRERIREQWLEAGVTMQDPSTTWIDADVTIGRDTVLYPHVALEGRTVIGEDAVVHAGTRITDCVVGDQAEILDHCVLRESHIGQAAHVGPFVHLRPGVTVGAKAKVGNFVEIKNAQLGEGAKANHLSYIGDATIGMGVNIGAGTITCNYDGMKKHRTIIGDQVFVGSDTQLVAPVSIGAGAVIAAGTTVTQDVPAGALAIARVAQVNRAGYVEKRRALQAAAGAATKHAQPAERQTNGPHTAPLSAKKASEAKRAKKRGRA